MDQEKFTKDSMPTAPESYWRDSVTLPSFEALKQDIDADVTIVGGGITGITTAYLLQKEGLQVVLLEGGEILNGTTGHTTAKITAQHDIIYDELIGHFGLEKARTYYVANMEAKEFIENIVKENNIDCDFEEQDAIIYATSDDSMQKLEKEYRAYERLGIKGEFLDKIPFNITIQGALAMKNQAQFHPLKYLKHLASSFVENGGKIYENTTADTIEEAAKSKVVTRDGYKVTSDFVLVCSHFPFYDKKGMHFARLYQERSYLIAVKARDEYPGGMYLSADQPTRSLRYAKMDGENIVLVGGEGHKTGHSTDTMKHYQALENFARQTVGIEEFLYRWSAQDIYTLDKVPYIGRITSNDPSILIATGYKKWGMSSSTAAARLLTDLVLKRDNPAQELFSPSRFDADPDFRKFMSQNMDVAGHFIKGKVEGQSKSLDDLSEGEGAVVKINGKRAGAYKDEAGEFHIVDTTCTHMKCELEWNNGEHSWDCPCHGSRFSIDGDVLEGPATKPLDKLNSN
ncbi:glycine/D-amino acid oxidase-like deaminating enzyme/nitrite reductase/ring-hydroxylating ferredoxin subunit [Salirhabdus euzebyi]|uniref:Glycine/D-amino acid oxidase-like deaminating enzyme/nitrite reductase/ring-hydroxylating ferredoxin subunit n=1 Tax=Salirhabdus euzebyi TaxID=394506 RepID=A0A841Q682_9BACI|nr:FAD-dependent oxidoreductase [Salirhabdus euzebyi]MBB6453822.1 glycine/D-amino acid oxidase-like deaminating enzyme/nitrite reductase/ring-hydroxylating ferredoxin subunit [Salirhabdus euzebyi]